MHTVAVPLGIFIINEVRSAVFEFDNPFLLSGEAGYPVRYDVQTFMSHYGLLKRGRDFLRRIWSIAHAKNDLFFPPKELDEKVVELHFQALGPELSPSGLHVDFAGCPQCGVHLAQKSEMGAHQMAPGGLIAHSRSRRALQLIRAERSPNGSWRSHPALAESSRTPARVA